MKNDEVKPSIDVYIACLFEGALSESLFLSTKLRNLKLSVTSDPLRRSLKAQMREANKINASYVIIIGEEELSNGMLIVKNLKEQNQRALTRSEIIKFFEKDYKIIRE